MARWFARNIAEILEVETTDDVFSLAGSTKRADTPGRALAELPDSCPPDVVANALNSETVLSKDAAPGGGRRGVAGRMMSEDRAMPLRDHFRPPVSTTASWEGFHGGWPMTIVQQLRTKLPPGYVAEPRVHLGQPVEIDVSTYERDDAPRLHGGPTPENAGTAPWSGSEPVLTVETDLPDEYQYEVRVYDVSRGRQLVAAVEIVSPANKDRAEKRNAFIAKCAALLQKGVAVSIIDLVTTRRFNLYTDLLAFIGHRDPTMSDDPPAVYAASCRWVPRVNKNYLEAWSYPLVVGQPLPTLPLWLAADSRVPLDLESSYEQACHDLWIP